MSQLVENPIRVSIKSQSPGSPSNPSQNLGPTHTQITITTPPTMDKTEASQMDHETKPKLNNMEVVITSLLAGAIAGSIAKTTIAPLDRTKINFQINKDIPYSIRSAVTFLKQTVAKEGVLGLWRGNSATLARIIPYAAIQFTSHEQYKKILRVDQDKNTNIRRFLAGSLAGVTSQSLTYPLDLARARMAVTDKYSGYKTLREVFFKIYKCEGPKTFFRGYGATVLGVVPYAGMSFFTYETLKKEYYELTGEKIPNQGLALLFGAAAGVVGQTSSYPLDIVRRRMQTLGIKKNCQEQYLSIWAFLKKIYREEGIIKGYYKGLSMNWIKGPIAVGISFATYEHSREFLRRLLERHK